MDPPLTQLKKCQIYYWIKLGFFILKFQILMEMGLEWEKRRFWSISWNFRRHYFGINFILKPRLLFLNRKCNFVLNCVFFVQLCFEKSGDKKINDIFLSLGTYIVALSLLTALFTRFEKWTQNLWETME